MSRVSGQLGPTALFHLLGFAFAYPSRAVSMIDSPTGLVVGGGATGTGIARDLTLREEGGTCGAGWARRPRGISRDFFTLDELVGAYDGQGPTDADVSQHP